MYDDKFTDIQRSRLPPHDADNLSSKFRVQLKPNFWSKVTAFKKTLTSGRYPWVGWAFVYTFIVLVFFVYRCTALTSLIKMYASAEDITVGVLVKASLLGLVEDFVCTTYLVCTLWQFDTFVKPRISTSCFHNIVLAQFVDKVVNFMVSWGLFIATMTPFVADVVIVRLRAMRFTFGMVVMAIEEKDHASAVAVSESQIVIASLNIIALVIAATVFALVRAWTQWCDLSSWDPTMLSLFGESRALPVYVNVTQTDQVNDSDEESEGLLNVVTAPDSSKTPQDESHLEVLETTGAEQMKRTRSMDATKEEIDGHSVRSGRQTRLEACFKFSKGSIVLLVIQVFLSLLAVALSSACSPLVAYTAMNTTLNELLGHRLEPNTDEAISTPEDNSQPWVTSIIDKNEEFTLYGDNTLFRRTTGFHGDLAFDIKVSTKNPPNVLLLAVESFRFHDSHYMVGEEDPSNLFKGSNITITPNFDKWAKRGIALRNYWSSWRTSRSVESLLFGQLPYDSVTKSGMTGGQRNTKLSGLPQLFTAKGYETFFTTGCLTDYDNWDSFLPAHGFDTVWSRNEMKKLAESDLGIKHSEWDGPEHRGFNWGVHDDLSFQLLGDLLINKTKAQAQEMAAGHVKKPMFLNHYTISSHVDFKQRPTWYDKATKPDFSDLYEGEKFADNIKSYLEIRYFTDMELGKFMDRMAAEGVLNDTIVVITGDHGIAPEFGNDVPEDREVSATRVGGAIIAEGRLGDAVGMVIDDATEQYDILNTLADITGVPEGGFDQDGVGRSLKRKIEFGERVVYSNNPSRKMSIVRGHERLRYDKVTDSVLLHNANTDHDMKNDLFPKLSWKERAEWFKARKDGRRVNAYFTNRWEGKCLLAAEC